MLTREILEGGFGGVLSRHETKRVHYSVPASKQALIVIEQSTSAVASNSSVTSIVKLKVPDSVGVPETMPVEASKERPAGKAVGPKKAVIANVYGPVPPEAGNAWEYGRLIFPAGGLLQMIVTASTIAIEHGTESSEGASSVTRTVKLAMAAGTVGVPETSPVALSMVKPGGRVPAEIDQTTVPVSPVTGKKWE